MIYTHIDLCFSWFLIRLVKNFTPPILCWPFNRCNTFTLPYKCYSIARIRHLHGRRKQVFLSRSIFFSLLRCFWASVYIHSYPSTTVVYLGSESM